MKSSIPLLVLLALPGVAGAVQISADPIKVGADSSSGEYLEGSQNLIGQGPSITGFSGNWLEAYGGAQSPDVLGTSLSYEGLLSTGGRLSYAGGGSGRCGRILTTPYDDSSSGTIYLGFLLQLETTDSGYRAFELHEGGFDDGNHRTLQIAVGETAGGAVAEGDLALRVNQSDATGQTLGTTDTDVNLLILRIDFSTDPGGDTIRVYRNPADLTVEANNTPDATVSGIDFRFDRVSLARFNDSTGISVDELRIATEFNDITGIVNPDADNDGMDDGWELTNMVDDPEDDPDSDELTNLEEFEAGTNPNEADTDADGIDDKQELDGTGNRFDSLATDPVEGDSDGDGLGDGAEVSDANGFVTNPNSPDTDSDGENDSTEIAEGTDPLDPASNSAALGRIVVDGTRDSLYGEPLALQTIETGFGDNMSELNAAYGVIQGDSLYLLLTGNLEANFNKLEILIDSVGGGSNRFTSAGNDNASNMDGLTFDSQLEPDYHLILRRGSSKFDLDFADLQNMKYASYIDVFGGSDAGRGTTGAADDSTYAPDPDPSAIEVAYDNSNSAGVGGDTGAPADQEAAAAVTTGLELRIRLDDLGTPAGDLLVCAFVNNSEHDFASNQFLGGLPEGTGNLGTPNGVDLSTYEGEQYFTVPLPLEPTRITAVSYDDETGELSFTFTSSENCVYKIDSSTDLVTGWLEVNDSYPPDAGDSTTFTTTEPAPFPARMYYRVTPIPK